jgi:hypothetical protein
LSRSKNIALVDLKLCQNKLDKIRELIQLATITSIGCHYCDFHVGMTSTDMKNTNFPVGGRLPTEKLQN